MFYYNNYNGSSNSRGNEDLDMARKSMQLSGHNLYSVLNNPRHNGNWALTPESDVHFLRQDLSVPSAPPEPFTISTETKKCMQNFLSTHHDEDIHNSIVVSDNTKLNDAVPSMFFDKDFQLEDPKIFEAISDKNLQEKLSSLLDRVELSLLRQISSRSKHFFEASTDQGELTKLISQACKQVHDLRVLLSHLYNILAEKCLGVEFLYRRQSRANTLLKRLESMNQLKQAIPSVQALLQHNDLPRAFEVTFRVSSVVQTRLEGVYSLNSITRKLEEYKNVISSQMINKFIQLINQAKTKQNLEQEKDVSLYQDLQKDLERYVFPLFTNGRMSMCLKQYSQNISEEIKVIMKTVIAEALEDSLQKKEQSNSTSSSPPTLARQIQSLTWEDLCPCFQLILEHVSVLLTHTFRVDEILQNIFKQIKKEKDVLNDKNEKKEVENDGILATVQEESTLVVTKSTEFAQRGIHNIFVIRKDVELPNSFSSLFELSQVTNGFLARVEGLAKQTDSTALRGALLSVVKSFLDQFHHKQVSILIEALDSEQWKMVEISAEKQQIIDHISQGNYNSLQFQYNKEQMRARKTEKVVMNVVIHGQSFKMVKSLITMTEMLEKYLAFGNSFPSITIDLMEKVAELLRIFNSRTSQLVLGAGAMQTAKLRSISARHLALASQSLELLIKEIPYIKQGLIIHLSPKQQMLGREFDRVLQDLQQHNDKIISKLVAMVEELLKRNSENGEFERLKYDTIKDEEIPSKWVKEIVDSSDKLYSVLSTLISSERLLEILSKISNHFVLKLPEYFEVVKPTTSSGKKRLLSDIKYLVESFRKLNVQSEPLLIELKLEQTFQEIYGMKNLQLVKDQP